MQRAVFGNVLMRRRGHQTVTLLFRILQEQHRLPVPNVVKNKTTLVVILQLLNHVPSKCSAHLAALVSYLKELCHIFHVPLFQKVV